MLKITDKSLLDTLERASAMGAAGIGVLRHRSAGRVVAEDMEPLWKQLKEELAKEKNA